MMKRGMLILQSNGNVSDRLFSHFSKHHHRMIMKAVPFIAYGVFILKGYRTPHEIIVEDFRLELRNTPYFSQEQGEYVRKEILKMKYKEKGYSIVDIVEGFNYR